MKKFIASLFVSTVALCGVSLAATIPVTDLSGPTSCNSNETDNINYYLTTSNSLSRKPYDVFGNTVDSLVGGGSNGSSINIWKHGVISSCNTWNRISNVVSADDTNGALIFLNADNCVFNIPNYTKVSNPTAIDAQIHYTIGYRLIYNGGANTMTTRLYHRDYGTDNWTCYPAGNTVSNSDNCSQVTVKYGSQKYHTGECLNYRVFRCGDGLVNSPYGTTYNNGSHVEDCDPNDPTHAGWNNNGYTCNASCQLVQTAPQCGNGVLESGEQCDPGSSNFGNGCDSSCHLMTPSCTLTVNPSQGNAPLTTTINGTKPNWATYTNILFGDGQSQSNPTFALTHTYTTVGAFNLTLTVKNNYNGQINGTKPTATCTATVSTTAAPYCGDGIINQTSEDCDPGSNNFGNGCNSNCKLMNPTCTLTVNPTQGNIPLTVSINGTTNGWWARITNLNFGDGQTIGNGWDGISFPQSHTYTTVGTFNLTSTVKNIYTPIRTGATRPVAYCSANVTTTVPAPTCGNGILEAGEQCDPGSNNFGNGCSNNCQLTVPSCTLTVNPNQGAKPLTTTINATKPSWATYKSLSYGDNTASTTNPTFPRTHTYNQVGTFNLTLTVQNNYNGQINGTKPTATCDASVTVTNPAPTCGNGILEAGEQCDPGSNNFGNGCDSSCHLMTPSCTLTVNPTQGNIPLNTTINGAKPSWATFTSLEFGDGQTVNNPTFALNHTYTTVGTFNLTLRVQNNYNGQTHGTKPTSTCSATVRTSNPAQSLLTIDKQLLTTGNLVAGDYVAYKIILKNIGSGVAHNAYIIDTLPAAIHYISSNIQGVSNYLFNQWIDTNGQDNFKYYNFDLNPNQTATVYMTGVLRDGYSFNELTNCAYTSGAVDCVMIDVHPEPYLLKEQKTGSMTNFTTSTVNTQIGETITYKVNFQNIGSVPATGQVRDVLPPCVKYVSSSIHGVNGAQGPILGQIGVQDTVMYKNFKLNPGQAGYMLVVAEVKGNGVVGVNCSNITSYSNTGYFKFIGGNTLSSDVLAIRPANTASNVIFDKTGNKSIMYPGETGLEFYITVTNQGPNSISDVYVDDIWPDNESCIIYDGWTGTKIEEVSHLRRHYIGGSSNGGGGRGGSDGRTNQNNGGGNNSQTNSNGILYAGQSFDFTIFAHVANNPSCVGSYINTGKLTYTEGGTTHVLYDNYPFQVVATPNVKISITKTVDKTYVHHGDTVTYTITYTNNGTAPLTNYVIRDYWPAMVQFLSSTPATNDIVVTNEGTTITWYFNTPLAAGASATITATGKVR